MPEKIYSAQILGCSQKDHSFIKQVLSDEMTTSTDKKALLLSIVVPCYNEQAAFPSVENL
jgi:hypothetical protein